MVFQAAIFLTTMLGIEISIGIALNTFILITSLGLWLKHRNLKTIDLILVCLGMARFLLLISGAVGVSSVLVIHWLYRLNGFLKIFLAFADFANFCSLWFGTLLCVFYCVKITNYNHRLFVQLKMSISRMIPRLLLVSVAFSFVSALPFGLYVYEMPFYNSTNITGDANERQDILVVNYVKGSLFYLAGAAVPLTIFCTTMYVLIRSLKSHLDHMNTMNAGFRNPRLNAHINAIKSMLCFLFFYLISFINCATSANIMTGKPTLLVHQT
ncbi:taste receptor type 2 member 40-like [Spea bombifrons]|uniref:taste receptor type 2 member 40-like n=1 Tax=Spea bombifrons TaxID=233779 RepID=UPI00234974BC|nr:taste receptor type 2 member 40-like [Spea bombifrons]